jgi:hypothetical protein
VCVCVCVWFSLVVFVVCEGVCVFTTSVHTHTDTHTHSLSLLLCAFCRKENEVDRQACEQVENDIREVMIEEKRVKLEILRNQNEELTASNHELRSQLRSADAASEEFRSSLSSLLPFLDQVCTCVCVCVCVCCSVLRRGIRDRSCSHAFLAMISPPHTILTRCAPAGVGAPLWW